MSGVTAFPLLAELNLLVHGGGLEARALGGGPSAGLAAWVVHVRDGLAATYRDYPFIAYGTDWLAFGHIVIALFFFGPLIDPVRNMFILHVGLGVRAGVPAGADLRAAARHPVPWRLVDCSFGVGGLPFMLFRA